MTMREWLTMTAANLGRGIAAGQIDPVTLCQTYLDAIDAHPMRDRIYARVTTERALAEAGAAADRANAGQRLSPLDGVPVSWKDLFAPSCWRDAYLTKMPLYWSMPRQRGWCVWAKPI